MDHISEFNRQWNFDLSPALACPLAFHGLHVATTSPFPMWASPCAAGIPNFFYCWAGGDKSLVGCLQPWMHKPGPTGKAWPVGFLYIGLDIQFLIWLYGIRTGTMILWSICGTLRHDSFYFVKPIAVLAQFFLQCFSSATWCNMDCTGMALSWEQNPDVRSLVRKNQKLLVYPEGAKVCEPTRSNCVQNEHMLRPLLHKLSRTPAWHLPHLDPLQIELALLSEKLGVRIGDKGVYAPAVELKKLLSFIKRRVRRKEVTKESGQGLVNHGACHEHLHTSMV